ncbi:MAG: TraR/DksA C4-type zinc finger protein [Alphaproteobacteria bacterium]
MLEARREELAGLLTSAAEASALVELDQQVQGRLSRMDALQGQEMAKATAERRKLEISQIDAALKRMDEGDYGFCVAFGEEIARKRLELNPAIARCVDCAG